MWHLQPTDWGVPASRPRLWIAAVKKSWLLSQGYSHKSFESAMHQAMDRIVGFKVSPLEDYLLPEDSKIVRSYYKQLQIQAARNSGNELQACLLSGGVVPVGKRHCCQGRQPSRRWEETHKAAYEKASLNWEQRLRVTAADVEALPGLLAFSERQEQCLEIVGVRSFPQNGECQTVELLHSAGRARPRSTASCILPSGCQYLTSRSRLLHPVESLMLQGIHVAPQTLEDHSYATLESLAGNAFETSCCLSTVLCTLLVLSQPCPSPERPLKRPATATDATTRDASSI